MDLIYLLVMVLQLVAVDWVLKYFLKYVGVLVMCENGYGNFKDSHDTLLVKNT